MTRETDRPGGSEARTGSKSGSQTGLGAGSGAGPETDPAAVAADLMRLAERSQRAVIDFLARNATDMAAPDRAADPLNLGRAFFEVTQRLLANPERLAAAQTDLWRSYIDLWASTTKRLLGQDAAPVAVPDPSDRRFSHPDWQENAVFDYLKQSYLLTSHWMLDTVRQVDGLDEQTARKVDFYTRQYIDAMSPTNFAATNPEVIRATIETGGENLVRGLENLLDDIERGGGKQLRITMTDPEAFEVGRDLAVTPGKVVFQNDLMQLIQYEPTTETVHAAPLLIVPPWINKYYILDLRPGNSFIRWAVSQGHTVFTISWVNPDERLAAKTFESYLREGPLAAIEAIRRATGADKVNAVGYCLGGTLLAITLAHFAAKGENPIASATFLTTMLDFAEPGELGVFIDEAQLSALEQQMERTGYLDAKSMANTFNMLRANDLIWSFVVNNYLLGKDPFPFDLLYWNSDSTRMPGAMHSFYLRKMYLENKLVEPGGIALAGTAIDLGRIRTPAYFLSTKDDHIAPWRSTFAGAARLSGPVRFVLAASGHIAGVVNPPEKKKYCHWTGTPPAGNPEAWFAAAVKAEGSWWPDWQAWVSAHAGDRVAPRRPGDGLDVIEDAPGSYVRQRA